jgi:hypothetical protein
MKVYRSSSKERHLYPLRSKCIGKSDFKKIDDSIDKPLYNRMHARLSTVALLNFFILLTRKIIASEIFV